MDILLDIILPVFILVLMGYGAARIGWFPAQAIGGLTGFVFNFAVPILLFNTMATTRLPETIPWDLFGSYYIGWVGVFALGMGAAIVVSRRDLGAAAIIGFSSAFSNTILLGLPIVLTALGPEAAVPLFLLISIHSPVGFTLVTVALEIARNKGQGLGKLPLAVGRSMLTNPIFLGVIAGLTVNVTGLELPDVVASTADLMTGAVAPCSLFALGATLTQYRIAGRLTESLSVVALKNAMFPLIVWVLGSQVFTLDPLWLKTAVLLSAIPTGVNAFLFADRYGVGKASATTTIFLGTGLSVASLSVVLYLLDVRP